VGHRQRLRLRGHKREARDQKDLDQHVVEFLEKSQPRKPPRD
jgi:hypothetical protein